jgi:hypothetical protein
MGLELDLNAWAIPPGAHAAWLRLAAPLAEDLPPYCEK